MPNFPFILFFGLCFIVFLEHINLIYTLFMYDTDDIVLYKYWLHERVTWEIVTPRKPMSILPSRGDIGF